jgi:hypothetical protein
LLKHLLANGVLFAFSLGTKALRFFGGLSRFLCFQSGLGACGIGFRFGPFCFGTSGRVLLRLLLG